jgi:hypothetical protein
MTQWQNVDQARDAFNEIIFTGNGFRPLGTRVFINTPMMGYSGIDRISHSGQSNGVPMETDLLYS